MKVLMFTDQEIWDILKILAALLHMGNIKYKGKVIDNLDATDIPDQTNVERVAAILGVNTKALISALTSKTLFAHGKTSYTNVYMIIDKIKLLCNTGRDYLNAKILKLLPF